MEIRACEIAEQTYAQGERLQINAIDEEQAVTAGRFALDRTSPTTLSLTASGRVMDNESAQPVVITTRKERVPGIVSFDHGLLPG